jgi:hypothetical protein
VGRTQAADFLEAPSVSELRTAVKHVGGREELAAAQRGGRMSGLKHSGIIIPVTHRGTVFDLTESEVTATFSATGKGQGVDGGGVLASKASDRL